MTKPQLIVALDVPSADAIPAILETLPPAVSFYKIGLELFTAEGPRALQRLKGKKVFLDLKLHDIPRTVARTVAIAAQHQVSLLTIHAAGGQAMIEAAVESARNSANTDLQIVAVTTLTSLGEEDLKMMGVQRPLGEHTLNLGEMAVNAGAHGLVCSPLEARLFREKLGSEPILVTPGIRPAGADVGDQKRIATPAAAVEAGASYLVVGRPILQAPDPRKAAEEILAQMEV